MIFFTVGTQLPFPRMFSLYTEWKSLNSDISRTQKTIAQTCDSKKYSDIDICHKFLDGTSYRKNIEEASFFISHAGMGSILSALESNKPAVFLARQAKLNEHRNDHQLATCAAFKKLHPLLFFCTTREDFFGALHELHAHKILEGNFVFPQTTQSHELIKLKNYLADQVSRTLK